MYHLNVGVIGCHGHYKYTRRKTEHLKISSIEYTKLAMYD